MAMKGYSTFPWSTKTGTSSVDVVQFHMQLFCLLILHMFLLSERWCPFFIFDKKMYNNSLNIRLAMTLGHRRCFPYLAKCCGFVMLRKVLNYRRFEWDWFLYCDLLVIFLNIFSRVDKICFGLLWFYGISIIVDYLMPYPFYTCIK